MLASLLMTPTRQSMTPPAMGLEAIVSTVTIPATSGGDAWVVIHENEYTWE